MKKILPWFTLVLFVVAGCTSSPSPYESEEEWGLAWRVWELESLDQNYEAGARSFDSLIRMGSAPHVQVMISGMRCLAETHQYTKAYETLIKYPNVNKLDLCNTGWFYPPDTQPWKQMCNLMAPPESITMPQVKDNLLIMYINDQYARGREIKALISETGYTIDAKNIYDEDVQGTDRINVQKLKIIIDEIGFPDATMVGKTGMKSIYTIIRNGNHDPEFQESQLSNVFKAALRGEILLEEYAFLYDQVQINKGNLPVYGTHFSTDAYAEQRAELFPPIDEKEANKKRMELGLMPLETVKRMLLSRFENQETKS